MASVLVEPNSVKSNRCSNPSRKVRLIGKIKGLTDGDSQILSQNSNSWITVKKSEEIGSSEKCKVFFETQSTSRKDGYELDYFYGQHEEIDQIYSREIQPMVLEVFDGRNASVIALGARGSGKTYTIQGSQEKPGIAVIAMSEILSKAKECGKSVSVSLYELAREHVKDLLNPNHPDIQILEDAQGKINIKGLSQVPVNSIIEFHDIYFTQGGSQTAQKSLTDQPHKGLMVHISSGDDKKKAKINFVDLAGYQDLRRSKEGITPAESNRKNKSLYALLNVVSAINANETRVPYRESILTRILQDSLGGRSHVLLLACLNHSFCQDSLSTISLVSRSYQSTKQTDSTNRSLVSQPSQSTKQVSTDSTNRSSAKTKELSSLKNGKTMAPTSSTNKSLVSQSSQSTKKQMFTDSTNRSSAKTKELSSLKNGKTMAPTSSTNKSSVSQSSQSTKQVFTDSTNRSSAKMKELSSLKNGKTMAPTSLSMKMQIDNQRLSTKKASSVSKGRKPVDEVKKVNSKQLRCQSEDTSMQKSKTLPSSALVVTPFSLEEAPQDTSVAECCSPVAVEQIQDVNLEASLSLLKLENTLDLEQTKMMKTDVSPHTGIENLGASACEENNLFHMKDTTSPPLSLKIRELCNNLKELCESTPSVVNISENLVVPSGSQVGYSDILEPKTPATESKIVSYHHSPRGGAFSNRSSRMKDSVVKECLDFLNSANKEQLKSLKHIGEKRATRILEMREESPIPFKTLDDLPEIGIFPKQIKGMMRQMAGFD